MPRYSTPVCSITTRTSSSNFLANSTSFNKPALSWATLNGAGDSLFLAEQIRTIDRSRLSVHMGRIDGDDVRCEIDEALAICIGLEKRRPPKGEMLMLSLCYRCESDFRNSGYLLVKRGWQEVREACDYCKAARGLNFGIFGMDGRGAW